jgi:energy-coupling factor transporter ATP-binding protein EcfA2
MANITLRTKINNDEYTNYIYDAYDIQNQEENICVIPNNIDLDEAGDWNIGVIYGGSGSGKTTILKTFGDLEDPKFDGSKALISCFDFLTPDEACKLLSSVGLSSVPSWLRPYGVLSNGEQYRAKLAYMIGKATKSEITVIDEYTSVVDREVACSMSFAMQKYLRKTGKRVIVASCHFDILEWLQPDWVYSPYKGMVEKRRYLWQRPQVKLEIFRCRYETWKLFKSHHYLTGNLNKASKNFCATWNGKPTAFISILPFPNGAFKDAYRGHRTVVLPDFQGMGLGYSLTTYFASLYKALGKSYYVRTSNPALVLKRQASKDWEECNNSGVDRRGQTMFTTGPKSNRIAYSFKYIGEESKDSTEIITFNAEYWKGISQRQESLF